MDRYIAQILLKITTSSKWSYLVKLKNFYEYGLGNTPLVQLSRYSPNGRLYLKLEKNNPHGSIKDRTAFYLIKDLVDAGKLSASTILVESSSGNLGIALGYLSQEMGVEFVCLVDPTITPEKLRQLSEMNVKVHVVHLGNNSDYRVSRIKLAKYLDTKPNWIWTNQYGNPSNFKSHYETTGPEIWEQTRGDIDYIVCSVGTGGTICGVGHYLKRKKPEIKVVGVEPFGSTIFGGIPFTYLNAGSGMAEPSEITQRYGNVIDHYCKVKDNDSIQECVNLFSEEGLSVGITSGSILKVGLHLAEKYPSANIVGIAPDGGEKYQGYLNNAIAVESDSSNGDVIFLESTTKL